jgi:hypothetical protein
MWEWLLWGHTPKPRPKQLGDVLERLLAAGAGDGESAFTLPEKELKRLCSAARDALLKEPTLLDISTAGNVVVVGDLHGQFGDLQRIFQRLGRPGSDDKVWIFLGDYIDRGPMGLEIVATLLALKLRHPNSIYLLRGNHECSEITVLFGFCGECQRRSTLAVWEAVMQVFDALPLAALLNNKVFLCHGGISPYLHRPQDVNAIRRPLVRCLVEVAAYGAERQTGLSIAQETVAPCATSCMSICLPPASSRPCAALRMSTPMARACWRTCCGQTPAATSVGGAPTRAESALCLAWTSRSSGCASRGCAPLCGRTWCSRTGLRCWATTRS